MFAGKTTSATGVLICVALLSACSTQRDSFTVGSVPSDYTTKHPIVLSEKEQTLDIPVASGARHLNAPTISNVRSFVEEYANAGTGVIVMMVPSGSPNAAAVDRVQHQFVKAIEAGGGSRGNISIQSYDASRHGAAAPVRLSYRAVKASTGQCGKWNDDLVNTSENRNYNNFGCASQNNLAAQITNPGDLLGPRKMTPIDAENRGRVISTYQN